MVLEILGEKEKCAKEREREKSMLFPLTHRSTNSIEKYF